MKINKRIIILLLIVIIAIFCFYFVLTVISRPILVKKLQEVTHKKVNVAYFGITPILNLRLRNLVIEDMMKAEKVDISVSVPYLIFGKVALNNLVMDKPEFLYIRSAQPVSAPGRDNISYSVQTPLAPEAKGVSKTRGGVYLIIKQLRIKNGRMNFIDQTVAPQSLKIAIKDIDLRLTDFYPLSYSTVTSFDLKARIPWETGKEEGEISVDGWLNYSKKNMEVTLKINGIDGIFLYPYYSQWVDLDKARIQSARLNFNSNIHGIDNNVTADCHLELVDIVRRPLKEGESQEKAAKIADTVLDIFRALNHGKIILDFTIKTKMDKPEFGFGNIKMAFEDKLNKATGEIVMSPQDVFLLPAKLWEKLIEGGTFVSKTVFDGVVAVSKEIKKTIEGIPKNQSQQATIKKEE
ncbi:MAG: DUF748 domain-containing protein [Candidatus Omnitrophica bacterium]|nr:DUF748 domain-containing protein [Candidatus Omnitrophota bacterium]